MERILPFIKPEDFIDGPVNLINYFCWCFDSHWIRPMFPLFHDDHRPNNKVYGLNWRPTNLYDSIGKLVFELKKQVFELTLFCLTSTLSSSLKPALSTLKTPLKAYKCILTASSKRARTKQWGQPVKNISNSVKTDILRRIPLGATHSVTPNKT